jgi:putative aldouronate transport system substrate-binding protein
MEWFTFLPLTGPSGVSYGHNTDPWSIFKNRMHVTDKCKHPDLAVALYDYLLNFDVQMDGYMGPRGAAWDYPDTGSKARDGGQAVYKLLMNYNTQPVNAGWNQANPMVKSVKWFVGEQTNPIDLEMAEKWFVAGDPSVRDTLMKSTSYNEINNANNAKNARPFAMPNEYFIPPLSLSETDNARIADINAVLNEYKNQAFVEFITGVKDINSNSAWNAYLMDLDRLGSKELAGILQKYIN